MSITSEILIDFQNSFTARLSTKSVYVCVCICQHRYGCIFQPIFTKLGTPIWGRKRNN